MKNEVEHKSYHYWDFAGQITAQLNQTYLLLGGVMLVAAAEVVCIFLLTRQVQHSPISYEPPRMQFLPTAEMPLPNEVQIRHFLRVFLTKYLSYTPATADANLAVALNMMTLNLRQASFKKIENEFAKIQDQRIVSNFALARIDPLRDVNLAYSVLGVREVHHLEGGKETVSKIVAHYNVRLAAAMHTEFNSGGLRVADFREERGQPTEPAGRFNATAAARQAQSEVIQ